MKKTIFKAIYYALVFVLALFVVSRFMNKGNMDMTEEMGPATLPVMYLQIEGYTVNELHGYVEKMDSSYMRDCLTTLGQERKLGYLIDTYGMEPSYLGYEVRSLDGTRLVEETEITEYQSYGEHISGNIVVKDLISPEKEYILIFLLKTPSGQEVRYYTRLIQVEDYHVKEKLDYVLNFHRNTFRREQAKELTKYLESNAEGDNSSFCHVNIHSSFKQVTWGDLHITRKSDPVITIRELTAPTGYFSLNYRIWIRENYRETSYQVEEYYRIRYTEDRMYLLDYEREMIQIFEESEDVFTNDKIELGICDENTALVESTGGNVFAFVASGKLYSYNVTDNKITKLFSFMTDDAEDARNNYQKYDIKILNVDETGNVQFLIYGYMNRGRHEGKVGVAVYRYNSLRNTIEEDIYIDYSKSFDILKKDIEQLSYVNKNNVCYLMLDGSVYQIKLDTHSYEVVAERLLEGSYQVSENSDMLVWQLNGTLFDSTELNLLNLNTGKTRKIVADTGNYISPLGFMGSDVIYGLAYKKDVSINLLGGTDFPMWCLRIENGYGDLLKEYKPDGMYIMSCSITAEQMIMKRAVLDENLGQLIEASDDQIMNTKEIQPGVNVIKTAITENLEKIVQIQVKNEIDSKTMKILTPKEVVFEGNRELHLDGKKNELERYYVYGLKGLSGIYIDAGNAVTMGAQVNGVVVGDQGEYIWKKVGRASRNQIMAITAADQTDNLKRTLGACLDTMLRYEGTSINSTILLNRGISALKILESNLPEAKVLDLTGCKLDAVLYYVNQDIPVLALLRDGSAVLITGFNETQVVLMDPLSDELYKISMTEAELKFQENGNAFITYIRDAN